MSLSIINSMFLQNNSFICLSRLVHLLAHVDAGNETKCKVKGMKQSAEENPPIRWWKGNLIGSGAFGKLLAVNQVGMHASISKVGPLNGENFLSDVIDLGLFSWWLFMIGSSNATRQKAQVRSFALKQCFDFYILSNCSN